MGRAPCLADQALGQIIVLPKAGKQAHLRRLVWVRDSPLSLGPGPGSDPAEALQHPDRADLRRLDPTVHPVPREAAPGGDGYARGGGVSHLTVPAALDPEPGAERPRVPLPEGTEKRTSQLAPGCSACQEAGPATRSCSRARRRARSLGAWTGSDG